MALLRFIVLKVSKSVHIDAYWLSFTSLSLLFVFFFRFFRRDGYAWWYWLRFALSFWANVCQRWSSQWTLGERGGCIFGREFNHKLISKTTKNEQKQLTRPDSSVKKKSTSLNNVHIHRQTYEIIFCWNLLKAFKIKNQNKFFIQ